MCQVMVNFSSLSVALAIYFITTSSECYILGDSRLKVAYEDLGDLNVGGLFPMSHFDTNDHCSRVVSMQIMSMLQTMEIIIFAINIINEDKDVLPGIKLGYVFLDYCSSVHVAMTQVKRFLPRSNPSDYQPTNKSNYLRSYKVIGVLGTGLSHVTMPVSIMLSAADIPIISVWDASDRPGETIIDSSYLIKTDNYQNILEAMMAFMKYQEWPLFSAILEDSYNIDVKEVQESANKKDMCAWDVIVITTSSNYEEIVEKLVKGVTRVVVAFVSRFSANQLLAAINNLGQGRKFLWLMPYMDKCESFEGAFFFTAGALNISNFKIREKHIKKNPWYKKYLDFKNCHNRTCEVEYLTAITPILINKYDIYHALLIYTEALKSFITEHCPKAVSLYAMYCFEKHSRNFISYVKEVQNPNGRTDDIHTSRRKINIFQANLKNISGEKMPSVHIGKYDLIDEQLQRLNSVNLDWIDFPIEELLFETKCQKPCGRRESHQQRYCCWVCIPCENNEIVSKEEKCMACPPMQWPTEQLSGKIICVTIPPRFYDWGVFWIVFLVLTSAGVLVALVIMVNMLLEDRVSNTSYVTLSSMIQFLAIVINFFVIPLLLYKAEIVICKVSHYLNIMCFWVQYLAMLTRSLEAYLEDNEERSRSRRYCIIGSVMLFLLIKILLLFATKSIMLAVLVNTFPIEIQLDQPDPEQNIVYGSCSYPTTQAAFLFSVSIFLLFLNIMLTFNTHKDPCMFQKTRFFPTFCLIASVSWVASVPAYFTAKYPWNKLLLQITVILVNGYSALGLCFADKIIAKIIQRRSSSTVSTLTKKFQEDRNSIEIELKKSSVILEKKKKQSLESGPKPIDAIDQPLTPPLTEGECKRSSVKFVVDE